jgi:L-2-hydroxyglutarate oxidase
MEHVHVAVIGGGIIGTATAMALLEKNEGMTLAVLEKENALATHQTGHNSGVIHSGLYYKPGSLKAKNCAEGRDSLYRFCAERGIPFERCGKLVVATSEKEIPALDELERRGRANGLDGLERLDSAGLRSHEPNVVGIQGLFVPQTGIVDFVTVTQAYAEEIRSRGGQIRTSCRVDRVRRLKDGFVLSTSSGDLSCNHLINCAGLQSDKVARRCGVDPGVRIIPFRGEYYVVEPSRRQLVRNLVYPVPDPAFPFLGVHFTRKISGEVEAGPNAVLAFKREGYSRTSFSPVDFFEIVSSPGFIKLAQDYWKIGFNEYRRSFSKSLFTRDLRRLVPGLRKPDVVRGGAGVRAQAVDRDGKLLDDFSIFEGDNMVHVLNAPSPAATASLSIGRTIAEKAARSFGLS